MPQDQQDRKTSYSFDMAHLRADGVRAEDALLALEVGFLARTGHNAEPKLLLKTSHPFAPAAYEERLRWIAERSLSSKNGSASGSTMSALQATNRATTCRCRAPLLSSICQSAGLHAPLRSPSYHTPISAFKQVPKSAQNNISMNGISENDYYAQCNNTEQALVDDHLRSLIRDYRPGDELFDWSYQAHLSQLGGPDSPRGKAFMQRCHSTWPRYQFPRPESARSRQSANRRRRKDAARPRSHVLSESVASGRESHLAPSPNEWGIPARRRGHRRR